MLRGVGVTVNRQYNVAAPDSLPVRVAAQQRRKMYEAFIRAMHVSKDHSILDVGATSDQSYSHSNYLEAWNPDKARITSVGIDDASFLEAAYPGIKFVRADGRNLPFKSGSFDIVHSSAVIEHVGSRRMQARFLAELWRVARKGIFVTTPNRWFPVEFHTVLPLLHWLPAPAFRHTLLFMKKDFFADERNLNLLSQRSLGQAARAAGIERFSVESISLYGWATNLILVASKGSTN